MTPEKATRVFLRAHGFQWHRPLDECDGCTRLAALDFIRSLPVSLVEKASLAEWVVSADFDD